MNIEDAHLIYNPLYPDFEPRELKNGDIRAPDVETYINEETGSEHIKSAEGYGTSLVDKPGIFGKTKWEYITIPAGTAIPEELIITKEHYMPRKKCWHYSISPNQNMLKTNYKKALDQLATNAKIKLRSLNAQSK